MLDLFRLKYRVDGDYYPIGMANFHERSEDQNEEAKESEKFFFKVKESYCKGHDEDTQWTVGEWRADQGIDFRDDMNRPWMELVMRRKSFGHQATLSEQAQKIFFMASTNLEKFKDFIFKSSFLDTYEVDQETLDKIQEDDIELLKFSYIYLASSLFGTNDLKIKDGIVQDRIAKMKEKQGSAESNAEKTYEAFKKDRDDLRKTIKDQKK